MTKRKSDEEYRLELGRKLKALRSEAGMSGPQLARRLGVSQSKVSKIENGRTMPTVDDVIQFADALNVTPAVRDDLVSHIRDLVTQVKGWQGRFEGGVRHRSRQMAEIENESSEIRNFQQAIVPGLLQTPQYARRMFELEPLALEAEQIPGSVAARMDRQTILYDATKVINFVILEPALRFAYLDANYMAGQIDRILNVSALDNVEVMILPTPRLKHFIPFTSFTVYDDNLAVIETFTNTFRIHDPSDVAVYLEAFELAAGDALRGHNAVSQLTSIRAEYLRPTKRAKRGPKKSAD